VFGAGQVDSILSKADDANVPLEADDVSLRLKSFVEKLDTEKAELANKLLEEQRFFSHDIRPIS